MDYWQNMKEKSHNTCNRPIYINSLFLHIDNNKDTYNPYLLNLDVHVQVCKASSGK